MRRIFKKLSLRPARLFPELEKALGYRFKDQSLLTVALTHRSYRFENREVKYDNQRMEFLGDAVLGLLAAWHFYESRQDKDEGWLTSMRSRMVSGRALAAVAEKMGLGSHLRIGRGEEKSGGRHRMSNLADAMEAVMGAVFLDGGLDAAEKVFRKAGLACCVSGDVDVWADNPKGRLQDFSQRAFRTGPVYELVSSEGPAHESLFTVRARAGWVTGIGTGKNKREAEKNAALDALKKIENGPQRGEPWGPTRA
jgi:ribonuclease-3